MVSNRAVLLVEDNPDDEILTIRALKKSNIANDIVVIRNGADALDYVFARGSYQGRNIDDLPSVVLLDLKLPKIDGLEVLRQIRAHDRVHLLPVVILTTSSEERDIIQSYHLGANSFVRKPVDFDQFVAAVHQLGMYWLLINELPSLKVRV